ncbi:MAG: FkbM family methyltransferase [Parvularculaceae bacterium]
MTEASEFQAFGAFAPSPIQTLARRAGARLGNDGPGRKMASLLLRLAGGKSGRAFDVTIFGGERARLHPYDNISEKRVFITPQFWEAEERALLAAQIAAGSGDFWFLDVGANAGLYTLFAHSCAKAAGRAFRALCVEPSEAMRERLAFNNEASGTSSDVQIFPYAAGERDGVAAFQVNAANRGESRLLAGGLEEVTVRPLSNIIDEARALQIDALKIDIEGGEEAALRGLFAAPGERYRPSLIIVELSHAPQEAPILSLLAGERYREILRTKRNAVFARV